MASWEVSIVTDTAAKQVVARDVRQVDLADTVAEAFTRIADGAYRHPDWKTGAVAITRMDSTTEARRAKWESDFYDVDRAGRRRRRYKRPAIEREWEDMLKRSRAGNREAAQIRNAERG